MIIVSLATSTRSAIAEAVRDTIDAGGEPGLIRLFSGVRPASADDDPGGRLLGVLTLSHPSAELTDSGGLVFGPIEREERARATGTVGWARVYDSDGRAVFDCDVGTDRGSAIRLNRTDVVVGGPIEIDEFVLEVQK